jgi:hypothetical protein
LSIVMKSASTVRSLLVPVLIVAGLLTVSCGNDDTPTTPTTPAGPLTEVFSGTLEVQGSNFFSFTVATQGQVSITLASLLATRPGPALNTVVGLAVGTPLGTDCTVTNAVTASPGLTAQLVNSLTPATYCARISDVGNLTGPVNFTVRIVHP